MIEFMNPLFANLVVDYFIKGGPVMWPILLCALAALVVVIERSLWWWQLGRRCRREALDNAFHAISEGRFAAADELSSNPRDPFLKVVNDGITHAHSSLLGAMQLRGLPSAPVVEICLARRVGRSSNGPTWSCESRPTCAGMERHRGRRCRS